MPNTAAARHCPTCRCEMEWRPYSRATLDYRECAGCRAQTLAPGRDGWVWRYRPPRDAHTTRGRATESLCPTCRGLHTDFDKP